MREMIVTLKQKMPPLQDVITSYGITLVGSGNKLRASCPFHEEKTPSFIVDKAKQIVTCFGACNRTWDVLDFIAQKTNRDLTDVIKSKLEEYGLSEGSEERRRLLTALAKAASTFSRSMPQKVRDYWWERGVSDEVIRSEQLGYCTGSEAELLKKSIGVETLQHLGLMGRDERLTLCNRFVIPIRNPEGAVIAFSGRADGDIHPKYWNTLTTEVFRKDATLYGMRANDDDLVLVEGYGDVLTLRSHGIAAVAIMGASMTAKHIPLLKNRRVTIAFDGDATGVKNTMKAVMDLYTHGFSDVSIMVLPAGVDPDELVLLGKWNETYANRLSVAQYLLNCVSDTQDDKVRLGVLQQVAPVIRTMPPLPRDAIVREIAARWRVSVNAVSEILRGGSPTVTPKDNGTHLSSDEYSLLHAISDGDEYANWRRKLRTIKAPVIEPTDFQDKDCRVFFETLQEAMNQYDVEISDYLSMHSNTDVLQKVLRAASPTNLVDLTLRIQMRKAKSAGDFDRLLQLRGLLQHGYK